MALTLTDFFVFGLGVEVVGAILIAKGLLARFSLIKTFGTYGGMGAAEVVDRIRNRVDAFFGAIYLLIGVIAQMIGYLAELDWHDRGGIGSCELIDGLVLLVVGVGGAGLAWFAFHEKAFKAMLVQTAFAPLYRDGKEIEESHAKRLEWLADYARAAQGGEKGEDGNAIWLEKLYGADAEFERRRFWWWPWGGREPED